MVWIGFIKKFFKLLSKIRIKKKYEITWIMLEEMLKENDNVKQIVLWDGRYKYPSFIDMLRIIATDITKFAKYRAEEYDCDNYAMTFAGLVPFMYGVNNVGIVVGKVIDARTGRLKGYHAWNVFIAMKEDNRPMLYMYEPQNGLFTTYKSGRFGSVIYVPEIIIWG